MTPNVLAIVLLAPFLAAPLVLALQQRGRRWAAWGAAAPMAIGLALLAPLAPSVLDGATVVMRLPWLPEWGLDFALRLDGLGLLFAGLILGIGMLIVLYAAYYLPRYDRLGRFYALLLVFAGGMLGVAMSENMLLLVVFWEVTSLSSFLLIAYKHEAREARVSARMALAVTGGGGLALLAGVLLLGHVVGSFELSVVLARGDAVRAHALYPVILVLVLLGAFTKSAQFPFHFWLPNAMAAPTPVSAYLHSATMVKAGVFLLARFYPVLAGTDLWLILVGGTGALTFVYGAYVALLKDDLKGLLAYSTISHLGLITLLLGLNTQMAAVAAVFHIINHATFKASLFIAAGIIDHETGTRDMRRLGGLFHYMPWTATLAIVAAAAMAGVPLMNGFLSKEMFFVETINHPAFLGWTAYALPAFATIAGMLSVAYSARFVHEVFFSGTARDLPRIPHEPPRWMRMPVDILVALVLLVGLLPQLTVYTILVAASRSVLQAEVPDFRLAIWHGFNVPLAMSVLALVGGLLYYRRRHLLFALHARYLPRLASQVAFERAYRIAEIAAARLLAAIDHRSLPAYLGLFLGFTLVLGLWAWTGADRSGLAGALPWGAIDIITAMGLAILAVGAVGTVVLHRQRLAALVFLSVAGLMASLAFLRFAAPDLALTQLSVEVVTIVLLLLALRYMPQEAAPESPPARRWRDATLAIFGGLGVAALCFAMLTRPFNTISAYHIAQSVPGGGGTNVVNVILVDFRGFDTLGEIAVLAMAGLGLHALLDGLRLVPHSGGAREADRHPVMLAMLMRPLLPLAIAVSVYIFLRGHNLPGGGFIAGLVTAIALMLQYLAGGVAFAQARLRLDYVRIIGLGLAIAIATGLGSWLFGRPFLTTWHDYMHPPLIDKFELASAMAFDLGVYLTVIGAVMLALTELGLLGQRERTRAEPPLACQDKGRG
jgi:multicomponent K+:H+ antiporter subunit A